MKRLSLEERLVFRWWGILADFGLRNQFQLADFGSAAVEAVAENGMAGVGQVDADLVRAACFREGTEKGKAEEAFDDLEHCDGWASVWVVAMDGLFFAL